MSVLSAAEKIARRVLNARGVASRFVETSHAVHHVYDAKGAGDLPTIVVLHGISSAATPFAPMFLRLLPHVRRVIAPEAPGHGFSSDPRAPLSPSTLDAAMVELFDRLVDEPAIVFGNSLGGAVALGLALARPERTRGLFLASPAGVPTREADLRSFLTTFEMPTDADARSFLGRLYHRPPWFAPLVARDVRRLFGRPSIRSFTRSVTTDDLFSPEEIASLQMPVHFLWGRSERLFSPADLAAWKAHLPPHATIEEPEGLGHCAHLDAPAVLAEKIVAFARRATR